MGVNLRIVALWGIMTLSTAAAGAARALPTPDAETVFLIHGQGRNRLSLAVLAWRLRRAGYRTSLYPYNQRRQTLEEIAAGLKWRIAAREETTSYHLIGHSLGNVVIREGFRTGYPPGLGRVVMLAPPNAPAPLAKRLARNPVYRFFTGDSGQRLADENFYSKLPAPNVEFGVIAADRGIPWLHVGPNDGVIPVAITPLAGMTDFVRLRHSHTLIMNSRDTFKMVRGFLRSGRFPAA